MLFDQEYEQDNSPIDNTDIVQILLYFDQFEAKDFKFYCKELMKKEWPEDFIDKGNLSDLLIKILKREYEKNCLTPKDDGSAVRVA